MNWLILSVIAFLALSLLVEEYLGYRKYGFPVAIRTRYILPVLPLIGYLVAQSTLIMFRAYRKTLLLVAMGSMLLATQGGGIVTYLLTTPSNLYWQNEVTKDLNENLKSITHPLVKE